MGAKLIFWNGGLRVYISGEEVDKFLAAGSMSLDVYTGKDLQCVGQAWLNVTDTARDILEIHTVAFRAAMKEAKDKFFIEHPDYVNKRMRKGKGKR